MKRLFFLTVSLMLATQIFTESFDWPQWRGPNSNGVSSETDWNPLALKNGARVLWTADIGAGYSNIAIQGNRVYAIGKDQKTWKLIFSCIDAVTGKTIWEKKDLETAGEVMATPAVDGDRVYGIGGDGMLFCLQTTDGRLLWQKDLRNDYHLLFFGVAVSPSPIVEGDLILINANDAGAALDKRTGQLVWASRYPDKHGALFYGSPVPFDFQGKRLVLFQGPEALSIVEPSTGNVLWRRVHGGPESIADPVFSDGLVFVILDAGKLSSSDFTETGAALYFSTGTLLAFWKKANLLCAVASPVPVNGFLYCTHWPIWIAQWAWQSVKMHSWDFRCIDMRTGDLMWSQSLKHSTVMAAGGKLILLDIEGTLRIVEATPKAYREISSADILGGASVPRLFVTYPVLCGGRIYCRNYAGGLICIDMSK